ncbi:hypothetical protein D5S17_04065 [Pseudonocardiaceae bacterium YIM PH 21723]|nr:hypothetical protein D5S17_04065 [Pseudonocardiaceae bacterium YIM PH 21723]
MKISILLLTGALLAGCATTNAEPAATSSPVRLVAADAHGAVLMDAGAEAFTGVDRSGKVVWTDKQAYTQDAEPRCTGSCPDTTFFAARPHPATPAGFREVTAAGSTEHPLSAQVPAQAVLTARSASDAVLVTGDPELWVLRTDGTVLRLPVGTADLAWVEDSAGTTAIALPRDPEAANGRLLRFRRDELGWRAVGDPIPSSGAWDGCLGGPGGLNMITGPGASVLTDTGRAELHTDLPRAAECVAGHRSGVVLRRTMDGVGAHRTAVRGVDVQGRQTWSRDYPARVTVAVNPEGTLVAVVQGTVLELFGATGNRLDRRAGVLAARFTPDGELVTVGADHRIGRDTPGSR